jgi:hypothetical protein
MHAHAGLTVRGDGASKGLGLGPHTRDATLSSGRSVARLHDIKRATEDEGAKAAVPWWRGLSTIERARAVQEAGPAAFPGSAFDLGGERRLRASYATAYSKIEKALDRLEAFVSEL